MPVGERNQGIPRVTRRTDFKRMDFGHQVNKEKKNFVEALDVEIGRNGLAKSGEEWKD